MKTNNPFLDTLNTNRFIIQKRNIETTLIARDGEETTQYLQVVPSHNEVLYKSIPILQKIL